MHGSQEGKSRYIGPAFSPFVLLARCAAPRYNASSLQFLAVIPGVICSSLP
jgi:hypothetical protein